MKLKSFALLVVALFAGPLAPETAIAAVIFAEDFESATATEAVGSGLDFGSTEREAGQYYSNETIPGWTVVTPVQVYLHVGDSGNNAVLVNEGDVAGISRTITGLLPGAQHELRFEYWGDNAPGYAYSFQYEINGVVTSVSDVNSGLRSGNFNIVSFLFTPTTTTTLLRFTQTSSPPASPLFDNISISTVPEPGTLILLGLGLTGLGLSRRRRSSIDRPKMTLAVCTTPDSGKEDA